MTTDTDTKPPAARAGSYRVGDLDLNRIAGAALTLPADDVAELDAI